MIVLQMHQLEKLFVTDLVFKNVNFQIKSGEKIGIVGKNGAGKTTLMKIMAGEMSYDSGTLTIPKQVNIGYLTQQMTLESTETVYDEMKKPFQHLIDIYDDMTRVSNWLSEHEYDHSDYEEKLRQYERLQNMYEASDGYMMDAKIKTVVTGLNFSVEDLARPVDSFSGGQKTRLALGQMLLNEPDLLLLDEPTNHLDMATVEWLENYLVQFSGAVIIISHDRYFLDKTVSKIFEIELFKGTLYHGNYSKYLIDKEKQYLLDAKMYERQQQEIKTLETFVEKNIARASTSGMAKSRRKQLEKIDRMHMPRQDKRNMHVRFQIEKESGNDVFRVQDLSIGYNNVALNNNINFNVTKQERIGIIGPNGIGKSTLVKTIAKELPKLGGDIVYGTNVSIGYYDQKQAEMTSTRTVLEELWHVYPNMKEQEVRSVLGQFLFTQEDVEKRINDLSGGEKARIQLAKLMLEKNNVLILDEPTNHLDIDSKNVLEEALSDYEGTILFVSHDRYFIDTIATSIIHMTENHVEVFGGDYSYFVEKQKENEARVIEDVRSEETESASSGKSDYMQQKNRRNEKKRLNDELLSVEEKMHEVEFEISEIEQQLMEPEIYNDYVKADELNQQLKLKHGEMDELMERYEAVELLLAEFE